MTDISQDHRQALKDLVAERARSEKLLALLRHAVYRNHGHSECSACRAILAAITDGDDE